MSFPNRESADAALLRAEVRASQRAAWGVWLTFAALVIVAVATATYLVRYNVEDSAKARACEARGGVWLSLESACVAAAPGGGR